MLPCLAVTVLPLLKLCTQKEYVRPPGPRLPAYKTRMSEEGALLHTDASTVDINIEVIVFGFVIKIR